MGYPGGSNCSDVVSGWTIVIEGEDRVKRISGKLASTYKPGTLVYQSGVETWTSADSGESLLLCGWADFKMRTSSTFGEVDIDADFATTDNIEIVVGPRDSTIKIAALCDNMSAAKYYGEPLSVGATDGRLALQKAYASYLTQAICTEDSTTLLVGWNRVYIV